jgi:hypothetical protein
LWSFLVIQLVSFQIKLFPSKAHLSNLYRPIQELHGRHVYASPAATLVGKGRHHLSEQIPRRKNAVPHTHMEADSKSQAAGALDVHSN